MAVSSQHIINWFRNEANKLFREYKGYKFEEKEAWGVLHRFDQGLTHLHTRCASLDDSASNCVNGLVLAWLAKLANWCWDKEDQIYFEMWILLDEFLKFEWNYIPDDIYEWACKKQGLLIDNYDWSGRVNTTQMPF